MATTRPGTCHNGKGNRLPLGRRYPADSWRFTPEGVKALSPALEFDKTWCSMFTATSEKTVLLGDVMFRVALSVSPALRRGDYEFVRSLLLRLVRRLRAFPFIFDHRYLHPPS